MEQFNKTFLSAAQSKPVRVFEIGIQFHVPGKEHFKQKTILGKKIPFLTKNHELL